MRMFERILDRTSLTTRYVVIVLIGAGLCLLCSAMLVKRGVFEPAIRLLHPVLLGRRSHDGYDPSVYLFYVAVVGMAAIIAFATTAYAIASKPRLDRKVDRYLQARLPRHEETISGGKD